ncbi:hypothetical protein D3C73_1234850 [compost metagenome]
MNHFAQADFNFLAVGIAGRQRIAIELGMQLGQACFDFLVTGVEFGALGFHVRLRSRAEFAFQFQFAAMQADAFQT